MKLTMNIDDELLSRVMETTGAKTKTEAIHAALAEIDRRNKLISVLAEGLNIKAGEWETAIDTTAWDAFDEDEASSARVAEAPARNDRKPRSRR